MGERIPAVIDRRDVRARYLPRFDGWYEEPEPATKPVRGGSKPKPRVPCSTPGCTLLMTGGSPHGCRRCQRRAGREKCRRDGLCTACWRPSGGAYHCEACRNRLNARVRATRKADRVQRAEFGDCIRCKRPAADWAVHCERCLKKERVRKRLKRMKAVKEVSARGVGR